MTRPIRIQRKRTAGWKMPPNTVYVGRPTRWGNPNDWRHSGRTKAVEAYRTQWVEFFAKDAEALPRLKLHLAGKNLACWCPLSMPCHADVLLDLANGVNA